MPNSVSKILSGGFIGLGEVFSDKVAPAFQKFQNSVSPNPRPVSDNNYSFNFAGAVQKLLQPFQKVTDPKAAAGASIINSLGDAASGIIKAAGNKAVDVIKNGNRRPETVTTTGLDVTNPLPSQGGASLGQLLSFFNTGRPASPALTTTQEIAQQAGQTAVYNVALVGGAALLLVLLTAKGR